MQNEITGEKYLETFSTFSHKKVIIHFNPMDNNVKKFQETTKKLVYEMY